MKRRFIRQNREIARVNSTQSQRIRNLETEISRLVAENISLREQVIAAQADAERWRSANMVGREILDIKNRLERKVNEVSLLLVEMGELPEKAARKGRRRSRLQSMESSAEQDWKNRQSAREAFAVDRAELQDGRLPAIQENKLYPRRTLENAEVMALKEEELMHQSAESPELGPPPVAHFEVADPIAFDAGNSQADEPGENVLQLPATLEKRRKRRTSAFLQDMPTEALPDAENPVTQLLKSGAKRKLDFSELEEPVVQQPNASDDFVFQRRPDIWNNVTGGKRASRFTRPPGRENENSGDSNRRSPVKAIPLERKVLAPKSTNSPAKRRIQSSDKPESGKDDWVERQMQAMIKPSRRAIIPPPPEARDVILESDSQQETHDLPPKTPAPQGDDILSPISTEPSVRTSHHPKEAAILNSVEDVLNGNIGRGSRRARPAVSYALPNLRDKMRRPGKELVGAVEGIEKHKESTANAGPASRRTSQDRARSESLNPADDQVAVLDLGHGRNVSGEVRWRELPLSLTNKTEEPTSPLRDKEKDRDKGYSKLKLGRGGKLTGQQHYSDELERAVDGLSIFDPPASSPLEAPADKSEGKVATTVSTTKRKSSATAMARRHSSIQPPSSSVGSMASKSSNSGTDVSLNSNPRAHPPRPTSAASLRQESGTTRSKDLKRSSSVSSNLKESSAEVGLCDPSRATAITHGSSAERTASRRRSMMV